MLLSTSLDNNIDINRLGIHTDYLINLLKDKLPQQ